MLYTVTNSHDDYVVGVPRHYGWSILRPMQIHSKHSIWAYIYIGHTGAASFRPTGYASVSLRQPAII